MAITDSGRHVLAGAWRTAEGSNDLTDAGLSAAESAQLNSLLLKVAATSRGRLSEESAWVWRQP